MFVFLSVCMIVCLGDCMFVQCCVHVLFVYVFRFGVVFFCVCVEVFWCLCVCICVFAFVWLCICVFVGLYVLACLYLCLCMYAFMCLFLRLCVYVFMSGWLYFMCWCSFFVFEFAWL